MPGAQRERLAKHPASEQVELGGLVPRQHRREADTSIRTPDLDAAPRLIAVEIEQRAIAGTDGLAIDLNGKAGVATAFAQEPALARRPAHVESPTLQLKPSLQIRATVTTCDLRRT